MQSSRLKQLTMQNLGNNFENKLYENKKFNLLGLKRTTIIHLLDDAST